MVKTKFSKEKLKELIIPWNLGELKKIELLKNGNVQTNIKLETTKGNYIFRYYENRSLEYVRFEINVLNYLINKKYPTAKIIKNKNKKSYEIYQKKPFVIQEFVKGKHISKLNEKQAEELVKHLAKLHKLTKGYKPKYYEHREGHDEEFILKTIKEESKYIKNKKLSKERTSYIKKELKKIKFPISIPKGIIHADYNASNTIFNKNKISGIIDFDDACYTHLIFDVSSIIFYWAWYKEKNGKINFAKAKHKLKIYEKYRKLNISERTHLYEALKMLLLTYCAWFINTKYKHKEKDMFVFAQQKIKYLNELGKKEFNEMLEI